jgi:hypothetical protein
MGRVMVTIIRRAGNSVALTTTTNPPFAGLRPADFSLLMLDVNSLGTRLD